MSDQEFYFCTSCGSISCSALQCLSCGGATLINNKEPYIIKNERTIKEIRNEFIEYCVKYNITYINDTLQEKKYYKENSKNKLLYVIKGDFNVELEGIKAKVHYKDRKYFYGNEDRNKDSIYNIGESNNFPYNINNRDYKKIDSVMKAIYIKKTALEEQEKQEVKKKERMKMLMNLADEWFEVNNLSGFEIDYKIDVMIRYKKDDVVITFENNKGVVEISILVKKISPAQKLFYSKGLDILSSVICHVNGGGQ